MPFPPPSPSRSPASLSFARRRAFARRFVHGLAAASGALAVSTGAGVAHANGRFPGADQLVMRGRELAISTSFGVLSAELQGGTSSAPVCDAGSSDASADAEAGADGSAPRTCPDGGAAIPEGASFGVVRWSCERGLGYNPLEQNELAIQIFSNGAVVVAGPLGLTVSKDRTCTNTRVGGALTGLYMSDVSVEPSQPSVALAISRGPQNTSICAGKLFESKDDGATWAKIGADLPPEFCAFTVDSAPSDPSRIYVSGNVVAPDGRKLIATVLASSDRGATWQTTTIPDESRPFIGAMDPRDRDTFYVRTIAPPDKGSLYVTSDAGKTFRRLATLSGVDLSFFGVTGLAVSPDGSKVAYGSVNEGLFVMNKGAAEGELRARIPVMCLTWNEAGLHACSAPNLTVPEPGATACGPFVVGRSTDDGRTFTPLLTDLTGIAADPSDCPAGTVTATSCPAEWALTKSRVLPCGAGFSDSGAAAPDAAAPPVTPPPPPVSCDCDVAGGPGASGLGVGVGLGFAGLWAFRRASGRSKVRARRTKTSPRP